MAADSGTVAAITRDGQSIIPRGDERLLENDHAFLVGRQGKISEAVRMLAVEKPRPNHIMIVGANRIGIRLAALLSAEGIHVKLIEATEERAHRAGNLLDRALVIHGDATDAELLLQEAIGEMDAFVSVTDDEELNLTASLLARHHGAGKTIALIKRPNYVPLATVIGIDSAVSPRLSTARAIIERQFVEVLIATDYDAAAIEILKSKPNVRVLEIDGGKATPQQESKRIGSGLLIQTSDLKPIFPADCRVVTERQPTDEQWRDLMFAWKIARMVKSNAIVYAADGRTVGVGAGQMSRVDSARIGRWKAEDAGLPIAGAVMASDAFFPFRDGIDTAAEAGIAAVIEPGGSMRDDEVIAAADEHGMAMVFTGIRHFRH